MNKTYAQVKAMIACTNDKAFYDKTYAICNEFGAFAIVYANCEQDAIDSAVDNNMMESQVMSPEDHEEYAANGWDDSYMLAGNASEPFWCEYLSIRDITIRSAV
jgi:hypothetical protein